VAPAASVACDRIIERRPTDASGPITTKGAIVAPSPIAASGATTALGCTLVEELGIAASRTFTSNVFVVCFTTL
jgi:hypothetical protein